MRARLGLILTALAAPALAQPAPTPRPTVDPLGATTAVIMYASEAEPESGWSASPSGHSLRAASPGRGLTYHVVLPEERDNWRIGVTARRLGGESPVRFDLAIDGRSVDPLVATPSAGEFGTYWSPLDRVGGAITLTLTPSAASEAWPGVEVAAIQLARHGEPASERAPVAPDETITGRTAAPRGGKGFSGSGGGGGGSGPDPFEGLFPEIEEPELPPLEIEDAPEPPPGEPGPPPAPEPGPERETPPGIPAPSAGLLLLALLRRRKR